MYSAERICLWMVRYACVFCFLFLVFGCGGGSSSGGGPGAAGVKVPIGSEEANSALLKAINEPTDENFDNLMAMIGDLDDSKESCLYKACGELLGVYRSPLLSGIMDSYGLEVGIETDFDALTSQHDLSQITYDYLKKAVYITDARSLLADLEERLSRADSLLAQAEGEDIVISLDEMNIVHFDTIDIQVMRSMANLLKALVVYLQAVDFTVVDHTVPYNGKGYDIRLLCTDPNKNIRMPDDDIDHELIEDAWKGLIAKNPNLLTYLNRAGLAGFRAALDTAIVHYKAAVTAIEGLSEEQRGQRYANAFSLDTELELESVKLVRDRVLPSVISCLDDPSARLVSFETYEIGVTEYIDGKDGFYYPMTENGIEVQEYCFNSVASGIRIYDLLNAKAARAPRDVLLEAWYPPEGIDDFKPYIPCGDPAVIPFVSHIYWDEPEETFEIPRADISIDGDPADWEDVKVFQTAGETVFKIARDSSSDKLYLCLQTGFEPSSYSEWYSFAYLRMTYGSDYASIGLSLRGDDDETTWNESTGESFEGFPVRFSSGDTGFEVEFDCLSCLVKRGSLNYFNVGCNEGGGLYNLGSVKLLPEAAD